MWWCEFPPLYGRRSDTEGTIIAHGISFDDSFFLRQRLSKCQHNKKSICNNFFAFAVGRLKLIKICSRLFEMKEKCFNSSWSTFVVFFFVNFFFKKCLFLKPNCCCQIPCDMRTLQCHFLQVLIRIFSVGYCCTVPMIKYIFRFYCN
jgi:hypothetical protein